MQRGGSLCAQTVSQPSLLSVRECGAQPLPGKMARNRSFGRIAKEIQTGRERARNQTIYNVQMPLSHVS